MIYYNPLDKKCKFPTGAVCEDTEITFRVFGSLNSCDLIVNKDGTSDFVRHNMSKNDSYFEAKITLKHGLYFYYFELDGKDIFGLGKDFNGEVSYNPNSFQLTVYRKDYTTPAWIKGGIIYQIFPDRFNRSEKDKKPDCDKWLHDNWLDTPVFAPNSEGKVLNNDFFGGDIKGIIEKLEYLKSLSVTAIYLNPVFKAYSNHRYDTGDYFQIDNLLGSKEDFENLIKKAEEYGIKIILDGVFNHTGDDSIYFNKYGRYPSIGAYQSEDSEYFSWYNFTSFPKGYDSWWGIKTLPAVNKNNDGFLNFIAGKNGVLEYYTKLGVGGWRLDVVDE